MSEKKSKNQLQLMFKGGTAYADEKCKCAVIWHVMHGNILYRDYAENSDSKAYQSMKLQYITA